MRHWTADILRFSFMFIEICGEAKFRLDSLTQAANAIKNRLCVSKRYTLALFLVFFFHARLFLLAPDNDVIIYVDRLIAKCIILHARQFLKPRYARKFTSLTESPCKHYHDAFNWLYTSVSSPDAYFISANTRYLSQSGELDGKLERCCTADEARDRIARFYQSPLCNTRHIYHCIARDFIRCTNWRLHIWRARARTIGNFQQIRTKERESDCSYCRFCQITAYYWELIIIRLKRE